MDSSYNSDIINEHPSNKRGESGFQLGLEASNGFFNLEKGRYNENDGGRLWVQGQEFGPYGTPSTVMESGTTTGIRVYNIRPDSDSDNILFDVEYVPEPSNKINDIDLNQDPGKNLLTITTTSGLTGKSLEIGFNNKDYVSFEVTGEVMVLDLKTEPYLTRFKNNIKVNERNGYNQLNIRAHEDSFSNDMSERPFSYNYTFEYYELPDFEVQPTSNIDETTGIITFDVKNIGPGDSPGYYNTDLRRIIEVTSNIEEATQLRNVPASTPFRFIQDGVSYTLYQKSQASYNINVLSTSSYNSISDTDYYFGSYSNLVPTSDNSIGTYSGAIMCRPPLKSGDSISLQFTGDFEIGKTYLVCADDSTWSDIGDTREIIDDFDNPSNNYFVFIYNKTSV